ncbi:13789_t:CDS:2, partial [Racocetra persica]
MEKLVSDDNLQPVVSTGQKRKKKILSLSSLSKKNKESIAPPVSKKAKSFSGDVKDDDPFISKNKVEGPT